MGLLAGITNLVVLAVAGVIGLISEGIRRLHRQIKQLGEENAKQEKRIDSLQTHLGLKEDMSGPGRLDRLEGDIEDMQDILERHEIYWTGDPNDPSQEGALGSLYEIRGQLQDIQDELEEKDDDT